jgi:hypothetical protein
MVEGLYIHIWSRTMKPLAIAWSGKEGIQGGIHGRDDLINVQCKPIWNCHSESIYPNKHEGRKRVGLRNIVEKIDKT